MQATIFYVDDDPDDRSFFQEATEGLTDEVHLFDESEVLLQAIKNPPPSPNILFVDLNMPHLSGFEILREIKQSEQYKSLPVVVYSTAGDNITIDKCRALGANLFITKPTSMTALRKAIRFVLDIDWNNFSPTRTTFLYKG